MNATITAKPTRRLRQGEIGTPRHILNDAPEIQAAQRVSALMMDAFRAHGINTPVHFPDLAVVADAIAQAMGTADTSSAMPSVASPVDDDIEGLIGN